MNLVQTKEKTIDGNTYAVTQLGAIRGSQVFVRLMKMVGPAFLGEKKDFAKAFEALREEDFKYLCDVFSERTFVDGKPLDKIFDFHFAGKYGAMFQWLFFCIETNFGDFLGARLSQATGALSQQIIKDESK